MPKGRAAPPASIGADPLTGEHLDTSKYMERLTIVDEARMITTDAGLRTKRRLGPHVRGHLLQFDKRPTLRYEASGGVRLLLISVGLQVLRLSACTLRRSSVPSWILFFLLLFAAF